MLIHKKEMKLQEVITETIYDCDKCKEPIENKGYSAFEFTLTHTTGTCYPSGGGGEKETIDLCESCAYKFMEVIKGSGYRVNLEDWDY